MSTLFAEPASPLMEYDDDEEPELDGLRNLSVSTDGTLDSLDENPTPPGSPHPIVHISPPGSKFPFDTNPRTLTFEDSIFDKAIEASSKPQAVEPIDPLTISWPRSPLLPSLPSYSDIPPTPPAVKLVFPALPSSQPTPVSETLAERRASQGKLSNRALLSLQQMRFEASDDAGLGLGVGPPSAGIEGMEGFERLSPGQQSGQLFREALRLDESNAQGQVAPVSTPRSPLLVAPDIKNDGRPLERSRSNGSATRRTRSRSAARTYRPYSLHSPSSPSFSPSSFQPASPVVKRTSAFYSSNTGPLTPLTPSHVPGAPSLGSGGSAFEWVSYSAPESPISPSFPMEQKLGPFDRFSQPALPLTPTSDSGSITPTSLSKPTTSHHFQQQRNTAGRLPASPLGRGRFGEESTASDNPFFATSN